ncbi:hypothetical protein CPC08DRAFT_750862 [Agrocybe pediades]|nr:hypothetical protein CPC08DRAFT_750862 [Agrocybe pediades]
MTFASRGPHAVFPRGTSLPNRPPPVPLQRLETGSPIGYEAAMDLKAELRRRMKSWMGVFVELVNDVDEWDAMIGKQRQDLAVLLQDLKQYDVPMLPDFALAQDLLRPERTIDPETRVELRHLLRDFQELDVQCLNEPQSSKHFCPTTLRETMLRFKRHQAREVRGQMAEWVAILTELAKDDVRWEANIDRHHAEMIRIQNRYRGGARQSISFAYAASLLYGEYTRLQVHQALRDFEDWCKDDGSKPPSFTLESVQRAVSNFKDIRVGRMRYELRTWAHQLQILAKNDAAWKKYIPRHIFEMQNLKETCEDQDVQIDSGLLNILKILERDCPINTETRREVRNLLRDLYANEAENTVLYDRANPYPMPSPTQAVIQINGKGKEVDRSRPSCDYPRLSTQSALLDQVAEGWQARRSSQNQQARSHLSAPAGLRHPREASPIRAGPSSHVYSSWPAPPPPPPWANGPSLSTHRQEEHAWHDDRPRSISFQGRDSSQGRYHIHHDEIQHFHHQSTQTQERHYPAYPPPPPWANEPLNVHQRMKDSRYHYDYRYSHDVRRRREVEEHAYVHDYPANAWNTPRSIHPQQYPNAWAWTGSSSPSSSLVYHQYHQRSWAVEAGRPASPIYREQGVPREHEVQWQSPVTPENTIYPPRSRMQRNMWQDFANTSTASNGVRIISTPNGSSSHADFGSPSKTRTISYYFDSPRNSGSMDGSNNSLASQRPSNIVRRAAIKPVNTSNSLPSISVPISSSTKDATSHRNRAQSQNHNLSNSVNEPPPPSPPKSDRAPIARARANSQTATTIASGTSSSNSGLSSTSKVSYPLRNRDQADTQVGLANAPPSQGITPSTEMETDVASSTQNSSSSSGKRKYPLRNRTQQDNVDESVNEPARTMHPSGSIDKPSATAQSSSSARGRPKYPLRNRLQADGVDDDVDHLSVDNQAAATESAMEIDQSSSNVVASANRYPLRNRPQKEILDSAAHEPSNDVHARSTDAVSSSVSQISSGNSASVSKYPLRNRRQKEGLDGVAVDEPSADDTSDAGTVAASSSIDHSSSSASASVSKYPLRNRKQKEGLDGVAVHKPAIAVNTTPTSTDTVAPSGRSSSTESTSSAGASVKYPLRNRTQDKSNDVVDELSVDAHTSPTMVTETSPTVTESSTSTRVSTNASKYPLRNRQKEAPESVANEPSIFAPAVPSSISTTTLAGASSGDNSSNASASARYPLRGRTRADKVDIMSVDADTTTATLSGDVRTTTASTVASSSPSSSTASSISSLPSARYPLRGRTQVDRVYNGRNHDEPDKATSSSSSQISATAPTKRRENALSSLQVRHTVPCVQCVERKKECLKAYPSDGHPDPIACQACQRKKCGCSFVVRKKAAKTSAPWKEEEAEEQITSSDEKERYSLRSRPVADESSPTPSKSLTSKSISHNTHRGRAKHEIRNPVACKACRAHDVTCYKGFREDRPSTTCQMCLRIKKRCSLSTELRAVKAAAQALAAAKVRRAKLASLSAAAGGQVPTVITRSRAELSAVGPVQRKIKKKVRSGDNAGTSTGLRADSVSTRVVRNMATRASKVESVAEEAESTRRLLRKRHLSALDEQGRNKRPRSER